MPRMPETPRPDRFLALSSLDVDVARRGTIRVQLLAQLRAAIRDLRLPAGARLPSTRAVAQRLHISRSTVTDVFDQLLAEGYLVARHGAGTYVSPAVRGAPEHGRAKSPLTPPSTSWERVSRRGTLFADITTRSRYAAKEARAFQPGVPAVDLFPFAVWSRIAGKLLRNPARDLVSYGDPAGFRALREAIAAQLRDRKHVACDADQVIVTSGTQQSLDIINRLMLDPDEQVWIEDPGSLAARATFVGAGVRLVPVPRGRRRARRRVRRRDGAARAARVRDARGAVADHRHHVAGAARRAARVGRRGRCVDRRRRLRGRVPVRRRGSAAAPQHRDERPRHPDRLVQLEHVSRAAHRLHHRAARARRRVRRGERRDRPPRRDARASRARRVRAGRSPFAPPAPYERGICRAPRRADALPRAISARASVRRRRARDCTRCCRSPAATTSRSRKRRRGTTSRSCRSRRSTWTASAAGTGCWSASASRRRARSA